jgi:membrane-associated phospholipid phosphatase
MKHYTFVDYATQVYSAAVAVLILIFHNQTVRLWQAQFAMHVAGICFVHFLVRLNARGSGKLINILRHFYPVGMYIWFFAETGQVNRMFCKEYLDPIIIHLEGRIFGTQPSIVFMQMLPYKLVSETFYFAYFSYYIMIAGVGIALFRRNRLQFFHYLSVTSFIFYICYAFYIFLPIVGPPLLIFQAQDYVLPLDIQQLKPNPLYPAEITSGIFFKLMEWIYRVFDSPGAAMPSSHVAIALCTVFFSFQYKLRLRYLHLLGAILLCLATVYCRYHYAVDVVAGILTAAILIPLGNYLYFKFAEKGTRAEPAPVEVTK